MQIIPEKIFDIFLKDRINVSTWIIGSLYMMKRVIPNSLPIH